MTTEETIGNRILGRIDDLQADREITCNIAAIHSITCNCGAVLDEKTVMGLQHKGPALVLPEQSDDDPDDWSCVITCCPNCLIANTGKVRAAMKKALRRNLEVGSWRWLNWTGPTEI